MAEDDDARGGKWADRPLFATAYWPDVRPCYEEHDA